MESNTLIEKKIKRLQQTGLGSNVLCEAIIDVISANDGWITASRVVSILRGLKVPSEITSPAKWKGKFPLLPEDSVKGMLEQIEQRELLNSHHHRNDYHVEYISYSLKPFTVQLIQKANESQVELGLPALCETLENNDGNTYWKKYLEACADDKCASDEQWQPFLELPSNPVSCCYYQEEAKAAMQKAPEHVLMYFEYAALNRYASYLKKTAKEVQKERRAQARAKKAVA